MKWWKYSWAVISNTIFIIILSVVFNSTTDSNTQKLLAASVIVYLCVISIGVQLASQIGSGFTATMLVFQSMMKRSVRLNETNEDGDLDEIDAAVAQMEQIRKERNVKILIHACFSIIIVIWMLVILLSNSPTY